MENIDEIGYVTFNLKEYDISLYNELYSSINKSELEEYINSIKFDIGLENITKDDLLRVVDSYGLNTKDVNNKFNVNQINDNLILLSTQAKCNLNDSKNLFKKLLEHKKTMDQSWFFGKISKHNNPNLTSILKKIYAKIINDFYSKISDNISPSQLDNFDLTMYIKNNKIIPHKDGIDENRVCVILLYLNDDYLDGIGGELIIDNKIKVSPIFGQVSILDFTKNNINHAVEEVISDEFKRFAFLKFIYQD